MARDRDYEEEHRRSNELAWSMGYENAYERRQLHSASTPEQLKARLEPVAQRLAGEGDYQSLGQVFRDLYDSWDNDFELGDLWDDMEY